MHDFLDIYVKLVIAVISFIAPIIVYLLSVFTDGIAIIKKRHTEQQNQITKLTMAQMAETGHDGNIAAIVEKSNLSFKETKEINDKRIDLLTPRKQLARIFTPLLFSLGFIMVDMIVKDKSFGLYNHYLSVALVLCSFLCFIIGLWVLRQIAWAIVDTKEFIAKEKSATVIGS